MEKLIPEKPVRFYLVLLALLFAAAFASGLYTTHPGLRGMAKSPVDLMQAPIEETAGGFFFLLLLVNNTFASLLIMFLGVLGGVIPPLLVWMNGFMMGMAYIHISESAGAKHAALSMIPQTIIEIPALLIVAA
ncbi:MAG: stage II sporulation protein M [Syntrophorhabdaceae bacterium]|nr:stage II sporulation protein M [Syntrophorhabdaceae bacterium]